MLAEYGKRVFLLAEEAVAAVQQVSGLATGRLPVGGSTTVGTYLLPALLARYRERHPAIECDIFVGNGEAVQEQLLGGGTGLALISEHAVREDVRAGRLAVLPVEPAPRPRPVSLVHRRDRLLSPAERAFLALPRELRHWPGELPAPETAGTDG
ncbi:LysR substrate-binding domain-containing protein [Streptomyces niger]|uniref:LysR substrate-binding domain-containing protein n=1 Tax=Streptomyces niger TaxID=66373 RepID=UPI00069B233C|nr:LysR substrate-binding domain-containing protein [Streptomyces niger]